VLTTTYTHIYGHLDNQQLVTQPKTITALADIVAVHASGLVSAQALAPMAMSALGMPTADQEAEMERRAEAEKAAEAAAVAAAKAAAAEALAEAAASEQEPAAAAPEAAASSGKRKTAEAKGDTKATKR